MADRELLCLDEPDQGLSPNLKHEILYCGNWHMKRQVCYVSSMMFLRSICSIRSS